MTSLIIDFLKRKTKKNSVKTSFHRRTVIKFMMMMMIMMLANQVDIIIIIILLVRVNDDIWLSSWSWEIMFRMGSNFFLSHLFYILSILSMLVGWLVVAVVVFIIKSIDLFLIRNAWNEIKFRSAYLLCVFFMTVLPVFYILFCCLCVGQSSDIFIPLILLYLFFLVWVYHELFQS